ncbi:MAG: thiamine transport system ATP-binding protein [Actinomycetota bacterium]|nr:thiamine transport system ATP-binding protein [Actinomycetota bacterium]
MLRVEHALVRFGGVTAVDGVDLDVGSAETVAILGPSGCGKTTLLRAIAGLQPLAAGRVTWDGADLGGVPPHRRRFGLMFQEYALFPHRDVTGNVAFGLRMAGVRHDERDRRVEEVLELVGLAALRDRHVAQLSGGEQQRVALARALAVEPRLVMLDEPLGALDRPWRERLLNEFRELLDRTGLPAIYVTHDHEEAFALADRIVVMRAGRVVQAGPPADVWRRPADPWTAAFLGFAPAVAARLTTGAVETPWGLFPVAEDGEGPVQVVLRPDAVRLDSSSRLGGKVVRCTFAGDHAELEVETAGPPIRLRVPYREAPSVGDAVGLAVEPDGVLVYPVD